MKWICALLVGVAACGTDLDLDGIWQYSISGDIASSQNGYCQTGVLAGTGQVQIALGDGQLGADASTRCMSSGGTGCDTTPCLHTVAWDCMFASNGDATCTPSEDGHAIASAFVLGKCSMNSCTMSGGPYAIITDVTIDLTRQR